MNSDEPLAHSAKPKNNIPSQTYKAHVSAVVERSKNNVSRMSGFYSGDVEFWRNAVVRAAMLHDLGKLDEANQAVLKTGNNVHLPLNHVDAGTACLFQGKEYESAFLVYGHHLGLCSLPDESVREKLAFRDEKIFELVDQKLNDYIKEHETRCGKVEKLSDGPKKSRWVGLVGRLAFSCLVDGDFGDTAIHYGGERKKEQVSPRWKERLHLLNAYVKKISEKSDASEERKMQRQNTYEACYKIDANNSLYSCDSPVGTGKTTAVMAHLLKAAINKQLRHIFVVLPYTNIIKQSVDVYRKALVLDGEEPEKIVAEHHHQTDFSSYELRQHATLWTAPIIVTTAVQFFETLGSNQPSQLRKLHELPGSAIFLDEAHAAIPSWLWPQAWCWLRELRSNWKCHFVLASGSLPQLWKNEKISDPPEDIPNLLGTNQMEKLIEQEKNRIAYYRIEKEFDVARLIEFIQSKKGPRLVVLNTVQSAAVLAWKMRESGKKVMHLSTALTPNDREKLVAEIITKFDRKKETYEEDWTLVATSCVEAGMDFSFSTAFRESCSASSLIQIAGRVNRHGNGSQAEVFDFRINDHLMRDNLSLDTSKNVLKMLFEEGFFKTKSPTEIVTESMRRELMSSFGSFEKKSKEIKNKENVKDYPEVAKLCKVIDSNTRLVIIAPEIIDALKNHEKIQPIDITRNSVQIRFYKINSKNFSTFCIPFYDNEELYYWKAKYDGKFLGYMEAIIPLLEIDNNGFAMA